MSGRLHLQEAKDALTMEKASKWLVFGYCCCLCTAGLSCLPYWCCYHSEVEEIAIRNATSGSAAAAQDLDNDAAKDGPAAAANNGASEPVATA